MGTACLLLPLWVSSPGGSQTSVSLGFPESSSPPGSRSRVETEVHHTLRPSRSLGAGPGVKGTDTLRLGFHPGGPGKRYLTGSLGSVTTVRGRTTPAHPFCRSTGEESEPPVGVPVPSSVQSLCSTPDRDLSWREGDKGSVETQGPPTGPRDLDSLSRCGSCGGTDFVGSRRSPRRRVSGSVRVVSP